MQSGVLNVNEYAGGVLAMDSGFMRDRMACAYLIEAGDEAAVIETGTNSTVDRMLGLLEWRGWQRDQVRYVVVTHVHLDHAGGAGRLMQALPNAELLVHPLGARHVKDPSKLEASARSVYGDEQFDAVYGTLVPVEATRVREMDDGDEVELGGRRLQFMDSPGHARHHFCVFDNQTRGWFTGDTFGLSYRELDTARGPFIFPTTTPIDFDPEAMHRSVGKLLERHPDCVYLTHYGRLRHPGKFAPALLEGVDRLVDIAERHQAAEDRLTLIADDVRDWLVDAARAHGAELRDNELCSLLEPDVQLNSQGLDVWLKRREKAKKPAGSD